MMVKKFRFYIYSLVIDTVEFPPERTRGLQNTSYWIQINSPTVNMSMSYVADLLLRL